MLWVLLHARTPSVIVRSRPDFPATGLPAERLPGFLRTSRTGKVRETASAERSLRSQG